MRRRPRYADKVLIEMGDEISEQGRRVTKRVDGHKYHLSISGQLGCFPFEVKAGNDLFALRERLPGFVFMGWLEKEVVNEGNEELIEPEIASKVPALLAKGRYFPNGDHGIQPLVTFPNLCRFMTLLHEVTGNPEGKFPRVPVVQAAARGCPGD